VTEALKFVLNRDRKLNLIKVVPVAFGEAAKSEQTPDDFLKYGKVQLITYD
jgi:hypothetical protein